jgi:putative endonuclease
MFTLYLIQNPKGVIYTGYTTNLDLRIKEHKNGKPGNYTYKRGPWELVYSEVYETKDEASKREKFFKSGQGRALAKRLVSTSRDRAIGSSQGS